MNPERGEIWEVQFRPSVGAEIQKTRPAVIMNMPQLGRLPLFIVVPLTDWKESFIGKNWIIPVEASKENGLTKKSGADTFQVKSVSEKRLQRKSGRLTWEITSEIAAGIALCVGYGI